MLLVNNSSGNSTVVLPDPTMASGRELKIKTTSSSFDLNLHTYIGMIDGYKNQKIPSAVIAPYIPHLRWDKLEYYQSICISTKQSLL